GTTRSGDTVSEIEIESDADICTFKAFMDGVEDEWSDGVNLKDKRALYFDNLRYTVPASESSTSTATATIVVPPAAETQTTPVAVPYSWLDGYSLGDGTSSGYDAAAASKAANGVNRVWECYVAGLDPTNATDTFKATIDFKDGKPVIGWKPDTPSYTPTSWYKVEGKADLGDEWSPQAEGHRFFRVLIETP
ncbi:MAG: hypothetical protein K6G94_08595, partial [Kiritimatiellae bacterium]|nr:hypothetical protein [Kiritimatiellia bacterium]